LRARLDVLQFSDFFRSPVSQRFRSIVLGLLAFDDELRNGLVVESRHQLHAEARDQISNESASSREHCVANVGVLGEQLDECQYVAKMRSYNGQVNGRVGALDALQYASVGVEAALAQVVEIVD